MSSLKQEGIKKMFKKQTDENAGTTPTIYSCFEKVSEGPKFASPSTRTALREIQASSVDHIQAARTIKVIQPTKNNADVDESDCLRRMLCGGNSICDFQKRLTKTFIRSWRNKRELHWWKLAKKTKK
ncbi:hypothetical protein RF11_04556 [Thelohanellus kitauei]|uniref:Uncharacterized protein n=1 Tax=Thelohanellus kitauei TaxID=669202 RepID=A0A0C2MU44_THEKT|nr:hypothetical protein RF11_04556 [Thelohanellus kitauei]